MRRPLFFLAMGALFPFGASSAFSGGSHLDVPVAIHARLNELGVSGFRGRAHDILTTLMESDPMLKPLIFQRFSGNLFSQPGDPAITADAVSEATLEQLQSAANRAIADSNETLRRRLKEFAKEEFNAPIKVSNHWRWVKRAIENEKHYADHEVMVNVARVAKLIMDHEVELKRGEERALAAAATIQRQLMQAMGESLEGGSREASVATMGPLARAVAANPLAPSGFSPMGDKDVKNEELWKKRVEKSLPIVLGLKKPASPVRFMRHFAKIVAAFESRRRWVDSYQGYQREGQLMQAWANKNSELGLYFHQVMEVRRNRSREISDLFDKKIVESLTLFFAPILPLVGGGFAAVLDWVEFQSPYYWIAGAGILTMAACAAFLGWILKWDGRRKTYDRAQQRLEEISRLGYKPAE